jgi:hypothetical protein
MTPDPFHTVRAELEYAERIVRKGFGTAEEAAELCGVPLAELQSRLAQEPQAS